MNYLPTIGLEIHAELRTETKMFCDSKNDTDETRPNVNICPVCMGHPGTLPVINKEAVRQVLRIGTAVDGEIADYTEFDRKNYFYPDIPKGYQISQYKHPLVHGGTLAGVKITRIHLEEDTARSTHDKGEESLLDFNRAGVPLMELVTEPVIHDAGTAGRFARELQLLLRYLGASEANMEKGEMRVEANISVAPLRNFQFPISNSQSSPNDSMSNENSDIENSLKIAKLKTENFLGTKVEVKNLNSFKAVEKAIKHEVERQIALLERGEKVVQETRGWDENKEETFSQRAKEESHDYRYFPDPDLPKLYISEVPEFAKSELESTLPGLPWARRERLLKLGLSAEHVEVYVNDSEKHDFFEEVRALLKAGDAQTASNYILTDVKRALRPEAVAQVVEMVAAEELSSRGAKDILMNIPEGENDARKYALENDLMQISDREELRKVVSEVVAEKPDAPAQYLVGQAMKKTKNRANPKILQELVLEVTNS